MGERCVDDKATDGGGHGDLGEDQDLSAVHGIGERATPQGTGQERRQLRQTDQAHNEGRAGQRVGLERHSHEGELRAQPGDDLSGPEASEVPVLPERADVDDEARHLATVVVTSRGRILPLHGSDPDPWEIRGTGSLHC